jgi:hypothetical protein
MDTDSIDSYKSNSDDTYFTSDHSRLLLIDYICIPITVDDIGCQLLTLSVYCPCLCFHFCENIILKLICVGMLLFIFGRWRSRYQTGRIDSTLISLTLPCFCACPNPGHRFWSVSIFVISVFRGLRAYLCLSFFSYIMTIRLYGKESQDSHSHNKRKVKKVTVIIKGKPRQSVIIKGKSRQSVIIKGKPRQSQS